jgi:hypothetical protein
MNKKAYSILAICTFCACEAPTQEVAPPDLAAAHPSWASEATLPGGDEAGVLEALHPTEVDSVDELPGDYYRPFPLAGQLSFISLGALEQGGGDYTAVRSCGIPYCLPEAGVYHAVPRNPAVGFAFLQLDPGYPGGVDTYLIDALWRDDDGALAAIQLRRVLPAGDLTGVPFLMYRQRWDAEAPDAPVPAVLATDGACSYYRGLALYFRTRALQCAYSACYPMSPWYSYWAAYYDGLAQAVCDEPDLD